MHHAAEDAAEHDPEQGGGAVQHPHHGSENGAQPCDVQQLNQEDAPARHDHVIHAVRVRHGRCPAFRVRLENPLQHAAVRKIAGRQDQHSQNEVAVTVHVEKEDSRAEITRGRPRVKRNFSIAFWQDVIDL